jgi:two-component system NtrC family sensor kinase
VVETVAQHGVAEDVEITMRRKDGSELPVSITMSQLKDSRGRPIGLVGVSRDISQRKALMDQIIQAERLASVGRLAAGVAHEINNPLAVIGELSGYLEDIASGLAPGGAERLDKEVRIALPKITAQIRRCRSITRRLLSFARKTEGQVETADVAAALDEVLPFLAKQAQLARIEIHRAIPEDLPVVAIEEVQLEEVLINLINNAIQAVAPEGGGNIWIEAERVRRKVVITVRDDGPGIPDEVRHRLFDPFFTTKEQGEGTGLGLSICYGILKRHDGEIRVESQRGRGAKFLVILKVHQPAADGARKE